MLLPKKINEQIRITAMYTMFEKWFESGHIFPGETHDFWECVYVVNGNVCVSANERVYDMSGGDIVFHKPLELHKFNITDENGAHLFIFTFDMDGDMAELYENKVFRLTQQQQGYMKSFLEFLREKNMKLNADCECDEYLAAFEISSIYPQMVTVFIYRLFLSLCEDNSVPSDVSEAPDAVVFRTAVRYMKKHIGQQLYVEDIAEAGGVSESTLKRIFHKYSGMSVHKYFRKMKTGKAIELLRRGVGVAETAEMLGFCEQGYFSYAFKRETGISPSEAAKNKTEPEV